MWKVGINAQLLSGKPGYRQAGIHTYIRQVLNHLPVDPQIAYTVFGQQGADAHLNANLQPNLTRWPTEKPIVRIAWEQSAFPLLAQHARCDLLHSMAFVTPMLTRKPTIVTVYDLSFEHYPERYTTFKRRYLQTQTRRSVLQADHVVTIAEDGKRDVIEMYGVPEHKVDVVTPGVDFDVFRPMSPSHLAAFKEKNKLNKRFILHVGTLQPRKNLPILIDAYAALNDPDVELIFVGGKGWLYDDIFAKVEQLGLSKRVRFTGFVADADLPLWYNAASVLVMPSIYEGFGIPIADAMACGTPVIASNASSLPEVVGDAGLLFHPQEVTALTECIHQVLTDAAQAATLRDRGLQQAKRFSWIQSGRKMAAIYRKVLQAV
ncbi:MAG: glycosyltransferase family 4 protein [Candidatus Promineifilaceae bacterium]